MGAPQRDGRGRRVDVLALRIRGQVAEDLRGLPCALRAADRGGGRRRLEGGLSRLRGRGPAEPELRAEQAGDHAEAEREDEQQQRDEQRARGTLLFSRGRKRRRRRGRGRGRLGGRLRLGLHGVQRPVLASGLQHGQRRTADAAGRLEAVLELEPARRRAGARSEQAVHRPWSVAELAQPPLNLADAA
jgi:hypothetical protein